MHLISCSTECFWITSQLLCTLIHFLLWFNNWFCALQKLKFKMELFSCPAVCGFGTYRPPFFRGELYMIHCSSLTWPHPVLQLTWSCDNSTRLCMQQNNTLWLVLHCTEWWCKRSYQTQFPLLWNGVWPHKTYYQSLFMHIKLLWLSIILSTYILLCLACTKCAQCTCTLSFTAHMLFEKLNEPLKEHLNTACIINTVISMVYTCIATH